MSSITMAIIGIAVLAMATVGFGASLATSTVVNNIGGDDDVTVAAAQAAISALGWTEEVGTDGLIEAKTMTFTVTNEDTGAAHVFNVCAVLEGPAATFQPAAGSAPSCVTTSSIAASGNEASLQITFGTAVDVSDLVDVSFSVEETT